MGEWEQGWSEQEQEESQEKWTRIQETKQSLETDWAGDKQESIEIEQIIRNSPEQRDQGETINQGDFNFDFKSEQSVQSDGILIEAEKVDPANISAIIGVVVGIIIFIIISIVLVLLGVQQGGMKKAGPAEDVISQSSYMTYSTTVSDHSVNYGPNWDKDMIEDLCSLDNDSFLNSLEAVTTTEYWGEGKY